MKCKLLPENERFWIGGVKINKIYILDEDRRSWLKPERDKIQYYDGFDEWMFLIGGICTWILGIMIIVALWIKIWIG